MYTSNANPLFVTIDAALLRKHSVPVELRILVKQYLIETIGNRFDFVKAINQPKNEIVKHEIPYDIMRYGPLGYLDMSRVDIMLGVFSKQFRFVPKEIENWDMSSVTMVNMLFMDCEFDPAELPDLSKWKFPNLRSIFMLSAKNSNNVFDHPSLCAAIKGWELPSLIDSYGMEDFSDVV